MTQDQNVAQAYQEQRLTLRLVRHQNLPPNSFEKLNLTIEVNTIEKLVGAYRRFNA